MIGIHETRADLLRARPRHLSAVVKAMSMDEWHMMGEMMGGIRHHGRARHGPPAWAHGPLAAMGTMHIQQVAPLARETP